MLNSVCVYVCLATPTLTPAGTLVVSPPEVFVCVLAGGVGGQLGGLRGVLVLLGAVPRTPVHRSHGEADLPWGP